MEKDPLTLNFPDQKHPIQKGLKYIDQVYLQIHKIIEDSRLLLHEKFKEAFRNHYKSVIEKKSKDYVPKL